MGQAAIIKETILCISILKDLLVNNNKNIKNEITITSIEGK